MVSRPCPPPPGPPGRLLSVRLRRAVKGYLERAAMVRHPTEFPEDAALGHLHNSSYDINAAVEQLPGLGAPRPLAARHHEAPPRPTLTFVGARAAGSLLPDTKQLDLWTKPDVLKFEEGVVRHGKNFEKIHKLMEGKYPVSQLVLYYFARWKKQPNYKVWQSRCAEFWLLFVVHNANRRLFCGQVERLQQGRVRDVRQGWGAALLRRLPRRLPRHLLPPALRRHGFCARRPLVLHVVPNPAPMGRPREENADEPLLAHADGRPEHGGALLPGRAAELDAAVSDARSERGG